MHLRIFAPLPVLAAAAALAGCSALQPDAPQADAQIRSQWPVAAAAGNEDTVPPISDSPAAFADASQIDWRSFFGDTKLVQLIEQAFEGNRDLRAAALNVERARALYRVQGADRYPAVNATGALTRLGGEGQPDVEQYQVQLGVTQFELDFFGRVRSLSAAALQRYLATEEARNSAQLSLVAEVANAYLALAADRELQRLAQSTYDTYRESLAITERRHELGNVSALDLSQSRAIVASAQADVARYAGQVQLDRSALELLVGSPIDESLLPAALDLEVAAVAPPPAQLPSETLLRRPDIQQAEHALQAANANLAAARAAFFPSIKLTGAVGSLSGDLAGLFESGTGVWSFAPQIAVPIFQAGKLKANRAVAAVDRDLALASYEKAIQSGFKEVADALSLSWTLADRREALEAFVAAATETQSLSQSRYDAGRDSYLILLDAQRSLYGARQALVQSRLQEQANRINLYKALGGGWNSRS